MKPRSMKGTLASSIGKKDPFRKTMRDMKTPKS
jgi:hypothetical protein